MHKVFICRVSFIIEKGNQCFQLLRTVLISKFMIEEKWTPKKTHKGAKWTGPPQFENKDGNLMMLSTDLALVEDEKFKVWAEKYSKDEDLFFKDFATYYQQLNELGCKNLYSEVPWYKIW